MFTQFFCLDCEDSFQDTTGKEEECPFCGSKNIMEDRASIDNEDVNWDNGHYEGDMPHRKHTNDRE